MYGDAEIKKLRQRLRDSGLPVSLLARLTCTSWPAVKAFLDGKTARMHYNNLAALDNVLAEYEQQQHQQQQRKGA